MQRMSKTRNRHHVPEWIRRLFGVDNVNNMALEELVRQAREPMADRPKAQLIPALTTLPRIVVGLCCAMAEVRVGVVLRRSLTMMMATMRHNARAVPLRPVTST